MDTQDLAFDATRAVFYGTFVRAAYAMYESDRSNATPEGRGIPPSHRLVGWIQMSDFLIGSVPSSFYGFVAQETGKPSAFVIAIRGASNFLEWFDDFDIFSTAFVEAPNAGRVSQGFHRIYQTMNVVWKNDVSTHTVPKSLEHVGSFASQIGELARLEIALATARLGDRAFASEPSVVVTGHSLGAALATMYALDNVVNGKLLNPLACTFASPRVGNAAFARAFDGLSTTSWRIVNAQDIVPNLPPDIFGYRHVARLESISSIGKIRPTPGCWHRLSSYLYLLDPATQSAGDCAATLAADRLLQDMIERGGAEPAELGGSTPLESP